MTEDGQGCAGSVPPGRGRSARWAAAWPYRRVTAEECERLHGAALTILARTGVRLQLREAVRLLREAGADAADDGLVRVPADLVEWALSHAPRRVTLYDQAGAPAMVLDGSRTWYGSGSDCLYLLDHRSGERRQPVLADVEAGLALVEALPNVDYAMSLLLPGDVDQRVADRHQMRLLLTRTSKPVVVVTYEASGCRDAVAMAEAAAGGAAALAARPFLACYVNTASGLLHNADSLEKLLFLAGKGIPVLYVPGSQAGVTGPATPAGAVAVSWAGVLVGVVLAQLVREGAPVVVKGWGGGGLDMRTMVYGYASPDQRATAVAVARWADLPCFALAGASDAKLADQQAAAEAALSLAVESLAGADMVHDLGYLESGRTFSFVQLAVCDELVGWLRHLLGPYDTGEEALALDVVDEVGPDGQFLSTRHTVRHCREQYYPDLLERETHEAWRARGGLTLAERAAARVDELLAAAPPPRELGCEDELDAIVREAGRRLRAEG